MRPREGILQNNPSSICKGFGVDHFYFDVFSKADYAISLLNERLNHLEKIKKSLKDQINLFSPCINFAEVFLKAWKETIERTLIAVCGKFHEPIKRQINKVILLLAEGKRKLDLIKKQCDEDTAVALLLMFDVEWNTSTFK